MVLTLYVIIEGAEVIAVLLQQAVGVSVAKVLKLHQTLVAVDALHGVHELVNQRVVGGAVHAAAVQANVVRVAQQV